MPYTFDPRQYDILNALTQRQAPAVSGLLGGVPQQAPAAEAQAIVQQMAQDTPQSGADIANKAVSAGIREAVQTKAAQDRAADAIQQGAQDASRAVAQATPTVAGLLGPTPAAGAALGSLRDNIIADRWGRAITQEKQNYATAQAAGDMAGMKAAHESADILRQAAQQQGINLDAYDAGQTLAQSKAASHAAALAAYTQLFGKDSVTPDQYYAQQYNNLRSQGAPRRIAQRLAGERAEQYQADWMADRSLAAYNFGLSNDNAINQYGAQVMDAMRGVDPTSIGLLNAYFAKPVNEYTYLRGEMARDAQLGRTKDLATNQETLKERGMDKAGQIQRQAIQLQGDIQRDLQNSSNATKVKIAEIAARNRGGSGSGPAASRGGQSQDNKKLTESQKTVIESVANQIAETENALNGDQWDNEGDGKILEETRANCQKLYDEGKIPYESWVEDIYPKLEALEKAYQHKYGYE